MALQMVGPKDRRAYNPDRDILWSLPRLFKRGLRELGETNNDKVREVMKAYGITPPEGDLQLVFEQVVADITSAIVDALSAALPGDASCDLWKQVYDNRDPAYVAVRALFSVLFVKGVICELPIWSASVKPRTPTDPIPDIEEVEAAASEFFAAIGPTGGTTRG